MSDPDTLTCEKRRAYLRNGQVVDVIAQHEDKYVVLPVYDEEGEEGHGEPVYATELFDAPPIERYADQLADLHSRIDAGRKEFAQIRREIQDAREESQKIWAAADTNDALKRVFEFIQNPPTHAVTSDWSGFSIIDLTKPPEDERRRYDQDLKMVTLYGKRGSGLAWKINQYSDGSGSSTEIIPCRSFDEAKQLVQDKINALKPPEDGNLYELRKARDSAAKYGLSVPEWLIEMVKADDRKNAEHVVKERESELKKAKKLLADLEQAKS